MPKLSALALGFLCTLSAASADNRSYDGTGNSAGDRGAANRPFIRIANADYADGESSLGGTYRPNARRISNLISDQNVSEPNGRHGSDFIWQWGQFVDHDITLAVAQSGEDASIQVVEDDDPLYPIIPLQRTSFTVDSHDVRQQLNAISSFVDASNVYGSDPTTALALRTLSDGRMKVGPDGLLPFNDAGLDMDNIGLVPENELRMAGDVRANEQPGLTCLHTLFVQEHNRLAAIISTNNPLWSDEEIYQRARKIVGAIIQSITYNEWLPALLGPEAPDPAHFSYDPGTDPTISNEFATALFRFGHSLVSPQLLRIQPNGFLDSNPAESLAEVFFFPPAIESHAAYEYYLKGLASQLHQDTDARMIDELRNMLFGPPGSGGMDLAALNIQRGREHGLPDYNTVREAYGLDPIYSWRDLSSDRLVRIDYNEMYTDPYDLDLWNSALSEDLVPGAGVGELMAVAIREEFTRLAEGDAFFYLWDDDLAPSLRNEITATRLSDVIRRNTSLTLQENVFFIPSPEFKIEYVGYKPGVGVEISFLGEPGYEYQVLWNSTPHRVEQPIPGPPLTSGDSVHMLTAVDPGDLDPSRRFYCVKRTEIDP